jgi:hypothetical protein
MADLQPLGSEKLQGMDKIKRILEIARFKENIPTPINETSRDDYKLRLADGNEYKIVKEKVGYIIKKTISESETDYIEPMKNRKYYSSYSQALKRLNLMVKEANVLNNNKEGISLFGEQKRYTLKTPQKAAPAPTDDVENVPPPPSEPSPAPAPAPDSEPMPGAEGNEGGDVPMPSPSGDDMSSDMPMGGADDEGGEDHEEGQVTFKTIQKLVGKLGQKLRALESQGDESLSSKDTKYVINSVLSALDLSKMDSDDIEEITSKFDDVDGGGSDEHDMSDNSDEHDMSDNSDVEHEEPVKNDDAGEMGESWDNLASNIATSRVKQGITPELGEDEHFHKVHRMADEIFTESKVVDILSSYFTITIVETSAPSFETKCRT